MARRPDQPDSAQMILEFIQSYQRENQRPPTIREMQRHCGFKSPRAVSYILEKLEAAKKIVRKAHSRGIQLAGFQTTDASGTVQLPLFDAIPAGVPMDVAAQEAPQTIKFLPTTLGIRHPDQAFAVRVRGDSMIEAGILSGDIVVLEKKPAAEGDIVAALVDGENTLKRLVREKGGYFLKAENPNFDDIHPVNELEIQGVVVGVLRNYAQAA